MDSIRFSYLLILKEYWNNNFCEKWRNNHGDILVTFYPQTLVKHSELNQNALKKKILKKITLYLMILLVWITNINDIVINLRKSVSGGETGRAKSFKKKFHWFKGDLY